MKIINQPELACYHTFAIPQQGHILYRVEQADELATLWQILPYKPLLVGEGANLLFVEPIELPIVKLDFNQSWLEEHDEYYLCKVEAGKDWHELVVELTEQGIGGLENLALIPGTVGAAPIQNIGAYGVELCQLCESVDVFDWHRGHFRTLSASECQFGYRNSLFKSPAGQSFIVIAVTLKLPKPWVAKIEYQGIKEQLTYSTPSPQQVMEAVVALRQRKLPDPKEAGNAGSFFKNPTVSTEQAHKLAQDYPAMPQFTVSDGVKIPAAWLIDQLGWKGKRQGGAQVHPNQALVLVNADQAKAQDVLRLAHDIQADVSAHFGVELEPEVRFVGTQGEVSLEQAYAQTCV